jgi:mannose-6-phosphate isomerase-like protein (cupin superfamily)
MNRFHFLTIAAVVLITGMVFGSAHAADPAILNIDSLLSTNLLGDTQELRSDKIEGDSLSSVHLTQVRGEVKALSHLHHKETMYVIRGAGRLTLGNQKYKVAAGEVITIPPGTPHSFYSMGKIPTVVISVFSPGFDGKDRVYENSDGH